MLFILKSVGLCIAISAVIGIISGIVFDLFKKSHPHQIVSNKVLMTIISVFAGIVISVLISIIMEISHKQDINLLMILSSSMVIIINILLIISLLAKKTLKN